MRTLSLTVTAILLASLSQLAAAQTPDAAQSEAGAHFEAARAALAAAQYQPALHELETAAGLVPSPVLEYYFGLAHEGLGHGDEAVIHFRRYLAAFPSAPESADIEQRIARLERKGDREVAPPGQPAPAVVVAPPARPQLAIYIPPPPEPPKRPGRWWIVFPIVGGALLLTTTIALALFLNALDSPSNSSGGHSFGHHWWDLGAAPSSRPEPAIFRF